MIEIIKYIESTNKIRHRQQIKDIFIQNSSLDLKTDEAKDTSFKKWTEYYLNQQPEWIYIALKGGQCVGYLMACPNSKEAKPLSNDFQSYDLFKDQFSSYPAHLHINTHPNMHGQGIGKLLMDNVLQDLKLDSSEGLHIITSPESENVNFYEKMGFEYHLQREFNDFKLLFMGMNLATA